MTGYVAAGMIISIASFFGALVYLYAFARDRYGDEVAGGAIWLLAAYPFAIFFGALYTESLFLLGTVGAFYHFSKQQFGRAACWGLLVGLTRVNGALLVLPLAVLALSSAARATRTMKALAAAAAPATGLAIYALFIWQPHRQSARLCREPCGVGPHLPGPRHAGDASVFDPRQRRPERLRRHARLRRAERDRRALRDRDDLAGHAPPRPRVRAVHGASTSSRRSPTAVCCRPDVFLPCCFRRSSGSPPPFRRTSVRSGSPRSRRCRPSARRCSTRGDRSSDPDDRRPLLAAIALLTALTVIITWPVALHLGTRVPGHDDPLFSIWRLAWIAHALPHDPRHLFDANIFYPHLRTLAYSDAMLFEGIVAAPLLWAGINPVLVYNLMFFAGIVSSGAGMFVLVRYLTGDIGAALVVGGDLHARAVSHRAFHPPRAAVDGVDAADAVGGASDVRRGRVQVRRADRPLPLAADHLVRLLRRVSRR